MAADLLEFEKEALREGHTRVAGVDEAGRGPLAGPVVAAAVVFGELPAKTAIRDSKALTPDARDRLVFEIFTTARAVSAAAVWPAEIDRLNIHNATLLAMERALASLSVSPGFVLVDGAFPVPVDTPQKTIKKGDARSVSIAAASIIAKTTRDSIMASYDRAFPGYGFARHKGYPTAEHKEAIKRLGPSPIHRRSFSGVVQAPLVSSVKR